jgi:hypothetical protein
LKRKSYSILKFGETNERGKISINVPNWFETMMINGKVSNALKSAVIHLENALLASNKKDKNLFADSLWHVAAELEYALFLFSIMLPNENNLLSWKRNPELKKVETSSMLTKVKNLLDEAERFVADKRLLDAYKSAYVARHHVLKVQEDLAKKKREMLRKK